jgi:hypothetical protein
LTQHRVPKFIPGYGKSYALSSKAQGADTAVVFVHGFGGKPTSTWKDFHGLVDEYSGQYTWWATSDLFFFAYESLRTPIRHNATLLGDFIEDVWHGRWDGSSSVKYKDLILAGHSEGGVIIRRLILDRYHSVRLAVETASPHADARARNTLIGSALSNDFLLASHLRLFAPACMGTNFSSWYGFLTSFSHFVSALTSTSLVRNELSPESTVLENLKSGTEQAHGDFPHVRALYTQPLFGVPDQIVVSDSYQGEAILWDKGYDHFTVCKPNYTHKRPLEFVRK